MARLSRVVLALLLAAIPAMATLSFVPSMEDLEQHDEEDTTLWRAGPRRTLGAQDYEGIRNVPERQADRSSTVKWIIEGRSHLNGEDTTSQVVSDRDYLNELVETSAASTSQEGNVAFVKTHKTGSTSMAAILYRYAIRHDLELGNFGQHTAVQLPQIAPQVQGGRHQRVDIMHYHISPKGRLKGSWYEAQKDYRAIMRYPANINFITVMREPRAHFLSFYYYFLQPVNQLSLEEFFMKEPSPNDDAFLLQNPLSAELGVTTLAQMEHLITHGLSSFKLIFLTDRFDEGLMVLRRLLGWSMIDMTYIKLNETMAGLKRWDGKPFVDRPSFDDLPVEVQNKIDQLTVLDKMLYTAAQEEFGKDLFQRLEPMSNWIQADLEEFEELQNVIRDYLNTNESSKANAMYRTKDIYLKAPPMDPF